TDGYGTKVVDLTVGEAPAEVEIKLAPNPGVTLRVVDARDGRLLAASVRVTDMQNRIVYDTPMRFGGSGGETTKIPLEAGTYRAVVMAPGYAAQNIHLTSPGTLTVGMTPGGSIVIQSKRGELRRARLVGADGREYSRGFGNPIFTIDPSPGLTQLDHVAPGVYTLQVLGAGNEVAGAAQVIVAEGQRAVVEI
ncbi:MAG TPA: hypothetical protein VNA04_09190, partial [Thermoanaerobaculia bacterium]|nr:hypothetical protein [Thermoanaerobaculia bacterium]